MLIDFQATNFTTDYQRNNFSISITFYNVINNALLHLYIIQKIKVKTKLRNKKNINVLDTAIKKNLSILMLHQTRLF